MCFARLCALLAAAAWAAAAAPAPGRDGSEAGDGAARAAAAFELQDQFGASHAVRFPRAAVSVVMLADREGSEQLEAWIRPLCTRYPNGGVDLLGVARLDAVPRALRPLVRALFRRNSAYPVMMDWTGDVTEAYDGAEGRATLVVIDRAGRIQHRVDGPANERALEDCCRRIDDLLVAPAAE